MAATYLLLFLAYTFAQTFTSTAPSASVKIGQTFIYDILTSPQSANFRLNLAPAGATVSSNRITWTPVAGQNGAQRFNVSFGAFPNVFQTFTVQVDAAILRLRCGGSVSFTDSRNFLWSADGSVTNTLTTRTFSISNTIDNTSDPVLFQVERWMPPDGDLIYSIPLPNGDYNVELGFSENWSGAFGAGGRLFSIALQGVITNSAFDIWTRAGGIGFRAVTVTNRVTVRNNLLNVTLIRGARENPKCNSIAIFPIPPPAAAGRVNITTIPPTTIAVVGKAWLYAANATGSGLSWSLTLNPTQVTVGSNGLVTFTPVRSQAGTTVTFTLNVRDSTGVTASQAISVRVDPAVMRINCGDALFLDGSGFSWTSDSGINVIGEGFRNDQPGLTFLFNTHTWSPSTLVYNIPIANGVYNVTLLWAEIFDDIFDVDMRVFTVSVENTTPFTVDVFARVGFASPLAISRVVNVSGGSLDIVLTGLIENPFLSGIMVQPSSATPAGTTNTTTPPPTTNSTTTTNTTNPAPLNTTTGGGGSTICNTGAGFVVDNQGRCVFPTTAGLCPKNRIDCSKGCAVAGQFNNLCRGGTCINGLCVKTTVTSAIRSTVERVITTFLQDRVTGSNARNIPREKNKGDTRGAIVRGAFHSVSNLKAQACLLLTDCAGNPCEFTNDHNHGLEETTFLLKQVYDDNNIAPLMSLQDFYYLVTVVTVRISSNGNIIIPYRWNHTACQCLDILPPAGQPSCSFLPNFPLTMPEPEMTFSQMINIMESRFGFGRAEWICLLGSHALGRSDPDASGYARHWTNSPDILDNSYFTVMADEALLWDRETNDNGQTRTTVTDPDQPIVGLTQFFVRGEPPHSGLLMLHSDMNMFWNADQNGQTCAVTHSSAGCPTRNSGTFNEFQFLQTLRNDAATFGSCFRDAFVKMIEMGERNLASVV